MAYLLDTHTLLWFISGDKQLPVSAEVIIKNIHESCFFKRSKSLGNHN
jgi:PIN domain nuclease of toxin-antitoxin system